MDQDNYEARKISGRCTYPGCPNKQGKATLLCDEVHRKAANGRRSKSRRLRRRRRRCAFCGRASRDYRCSRCIARDNRRKNAGDTKSGTKWSEKQRRIAARTVIDADGRSRYKGQQRRGAPSKETEDESDLSDLRRYLDMALEGRAQETSPEVQALPRIQRGDYEMRWLADLYRVHRFAEEVLRRHRYPMGDDDEIAADGAED